MGDPETTRQPWRERVTRLGIPRSRSRLAPPGASASTPTHAPTAASTTCRAANLSLRFAPGGTVYVCSANDENPLGRIGLQTIGELWGGSRLAALRPALASGDYSLGCAQCGSEIEAGNRSVTLAAIYDEFPDGPSAWPRFIEFALSNTCNLQCRMCNGDLSSSIRAKREHRAPLASPYDDTFFDEIAAYLPHLEVAVFLGGEPFLGRETRRLWDMLIDLDLHPRVQVTTNGTVWNDDVERYLRELRMIVAMSIDGHTASTNESIRIGTDHAEVGRNRARFRAVLAEWDAPLYVNHCFMLQNWHELGDMLREADGVGDRVVLVPVRAPERDSLFRQPLEVVRRVVRSMEAESPSLEVELTTNRHVWFEALSMMQDHLRQIEAGEGSALFGAKLVADPEQALLEAIASLRTTTGREPLVTRVELGIVVELQAVPAWAEVLQPEQWIGESVESMVGRLTPLGRMGELDIDRSQPGISSVRADLATQGPPRAVHSVYINQYAPQSYLALAVSGAVPAGSPSTERVEHSATVHPGS